MRSVTRLGLCAAACMPIAAGCLVRHPLPDLPAPEIVHETHRSKHANGTLASETQELVHADGRTERDGFEREYHANGQLLAERFFDHGTPTGLWRCWYPDGSPRSEIDFRPATEGVRRVDRFWHANGALAAEGPVVAGVREGRWSFFAPNSRPLQAGAYRAGKRDGPWAFYDPRGEKHAEGSYALGVRIGVWTLWDDQGQPHSSPASEVTLDEP